MTVAELIERLNECDPNAEVRLATQPTYPLQSTLRGVAASEDDGEDGFSQATGPVYLVEGSQDANQPYAPGWVFDAAC